MAASASRLPRLLQEPRPLVMGILNVTPDSFSDGGLYLEPHKALAHARQMIADGADIIDIGGESTRPGAAPVPLEEELARTLPVIESIRAESDIAISIDTRKAQVMREAAALGVDLINDVSALEGEGALAAAAETALPICLMHKQGDPATMQDNPQYKDVVAEVRAYFKARIAICEQAGIPRTRLILDFGFGFGKTPAHNLRLLSRLADFLSLGCPLLVGASRKSTLARLTPSLLPASLAAAAIAAINGVRIVRAHDIPETVAALSVVTSIQQAN